MNKLILITLIILMGACSIVGPGERGVRIILGSVSEDPKPPGAYLWLPTLYGMANVDVQIRKSEIQAESASKDMQDIHATVAVNWALIPDQVVKIYKELGDERDVESRILTPAVNEVMKAASAKRTAEEVLTHRIDLKQDVDIGLKDRLSHYGIILHDISIVELKFSPGFTNAVEQKQIAEQRAKQASYEAEKATQDARADVEHAKGQAEAQKLQRLTLTPELVRLEAIKKWNGILPTYIGSGAVPFINLEGERK